MLPPYRFVVEPLWSAIRQCTSALRVWLRDGFARHHQHAPLLPNNRDPRQPVAIRATAYRPPARLDRRRHNGQRRY